jgi:hypothetical protein
MITDLQDISIAVSILIIIAIGLWQFRKRQDTPTEPEQLLDSVYSQGEAQ